MPLALSLGSLSLNIARFRESAYIRTQPREGGLTYTTAGTAIDDGTSYELPMIWTVSCYLNENEVRILQAMWFEQEYLKRSSQNADILIHDSTLEHTERYPATRAQVPATTATIIGANAYISYFAQFKGRIQSQPTLEVSVKDGSLKKFVAVFTLLETSKVTP